MLKNVLILASVLALVLASAQLALAKQDAEPTQMQATNQQLSGTDGTGGTQNAGREQTATPPGGAPADPPPAGTDQNGLMHLNKKNKLVIDCTAVDDALAQPQGAASTPSDLQTRAAPKGLNELSQLCKDSGFVPGNIGGGTPGVSGSNDTTIPPQSQLNGSNPIPAGTSSTPPRQTGGTSSGG